MKVLVIPDIHLKFWIFDRAEEILNTGKANKAVCLMDMESMKKVHDISEGQI
ncbi:hypothetical protein [Butyrivibrio sp. JL13D10]|uniref:hypothetical protein n=1 Tax=Butyrivibrio sp. JL13D10 TaxID=3236815 RepID=UPI0038B59CCC